MKAIRVHACGEPEVMRYEEVPKPSPGAAESLVSLEAIGLNSIDVYHRTALYPLALPFTPGLEGAGTVEAVGEGREGGESRGPHGLRLRAGILRGVRGRAGGGARETAGRGGRQIRLRIERTCRVLRLFLHL